MTNKEKLAAIFAKQELQTTRNPYHIPCDSGVYDMPEEILTIAEQYFREVYACFGTEAQVLVFTQSAFEQTEMHIPTFQTDVCFNGEKLVIAVLPQFNTVANTIVKESYLYKHVTSKGIVPVMRIHSHHVFGAYQSATDYHSLNLGTLEVVLGGFDKGEVELAWWFDEAGTNRKATYWTKKNGVVKRHQRVVRTVENSDERDHDAACEMAKRIG